MSGNLLSKHFLKPVVIERSEIRVQCLFVFCREYLVKYLCLSFLNFQYRFGGTEADQPVGIAQAAKQGRDRGRVGDFAQTDHGTETHEPHRIVY